MAHSPPDWIWSSESRYLGRRMHVYERLDSTNNLALSLCTDPTLHGQVIVALEQTAGRGQYGRTWQAPPASSVLMSMLLFPPPPLRRPALLTAWAAVSVCETIFTTCGLDPRIKWPNDVLINHKKVCGILIEQRTTGHSEFPVAATIGIGLNLTQSAQTFKDAGLPDAISLQSVSATPILHEAVARELARQLDEHFHPLMENNFGSLEVKWRQRLALVGKQVLVETAQQLRRGKLANATLECVTLEMDGGEMLRFTPEQIRHLQPAGVYDGAP